jgi:leukotriene-A4 hydrolase
MITVDHYSYSNPGSVLVEHMEADWHISFIKRRLEGHVVLTIAQKHQHKHQRLILDARDLTIARVELSSDGTTFEKTVFEIGENDAIKGSALIIGLKKSSQYIRIFYSTNPQVPGLQWLNKEQTADKRKALLFNMACPIHARDLFPIQDSPQVRITYKIKIKTDPALMVLMSAENNPTEKNNQGHYEFLMTKPIPPYLIGLAVGDFKFEALSDRTGIYAEPSIIGKAAEEFKHLPAMMRAAESLYGAYPWGRYDLLILPPSFPAGGMENPLLTFLSPSIMTGDQSLISTIVHELAHAWSGNLVTNATWNDIWLNEGLTTYFQNRIVELLYGTAQADIEARLDYEAFLKQKESLSTYEQILDQNPYNPNPEAIFTQTPYVKGFLFIKHLEQVFGRETLDQFLLDYMKHFSFKSLSTLQFEAYLKQHLLDKKPRKITKICLNQWLHEADFPNTFIEPSDSALKQIAEQAKQYAAGTRSIQQLDPTYWRGQQWGYFLNQLPDSLSTLQLQELDQAFYFNQSANASLLSQWLVLGIQHHYQPAYERLEDYLLSTGRLSLIKPLYQALGKTEKDRSLAIDIYSKARSSYHLLSTMALDPILGYKVLGCVSRPV